MTNRMRADTSWRGRLLLGFVLAALAGLAAFSLMFSSWSEWSPSEPVDADAAFARALQSSAGGPAYVYFSEEGQTRVRRELEREPSAELDALALLAWDPERQRLLRVRFPWWFVRVKSSRTLNLGTLISALSRDWRNLDLAITEEDLERRGPGLILDHELDSGARLLLWSE